MKSVTKCRRYVIKLMQTACQTGGSIDDRLQTADRLCRQSSEDTVTVVDTRVYQTTDQLPGGVEVIDRRKIESVATNKNKTEPVYLVNFIKQISLSDGVPVY